MISIKNIAVFFCFFAISSCVFASDEGKTDANFLSVTDIHFDPFTTCTKDVTPCPIIEKLQQARVDEWPSILENFDKLPPKYKQDTNYPLLKSTLAELKKTAEKKDPRFVLVLGDFLGHSFRQNYDFYSSDKTQAGYQAFVKKTLEFLTGELNTAFPSTDVYSIVGNNDSYEDDYVSEPRGDFFSETGVTWSRLIKNKHHRRVMKKEFSEGGYYAIDLKSPSNLRLIVLNSALFSAKAKGTGVDAAAQQELDWLDDELQKTAKEQKTALVALHIPVGIDVFASLKNNPFAVVELWKPVYSARFQAELQTYAKQITAILPAHFHTDAFQVLTMQNGESIPVSFTPSISPLFGNNPGFKVYRYSPRSHQLTDYTTYVNSLNSTQEWTKEYDFSEVYNSNQLLEGMNRLRESGDLTDRFITYFTGGTGGQPISTKWAPYYWCDIHTVSVVEYQNCVNID